VGFGRGVTPLSAVKFQIFTTLAERKTMSAIELKSHLGFKSTDRNVYDYLMRYNIGFLTVKVCLKLPSIQTEGHRFFFLTKKPSYIGGMLEIKQSSLRFWGNL
jgi:hypothetical protein